MFSWIPLVRSTFHIQQQYCCQTIMLVTVSVSRLNSDGWLYKHRLTWMWVGSWQICHRLNYPLRWMSSNKHFVVIISRSCVSLYHTIKVFHPIPGKLSMWPTHHISMMTVRGESSYLEVLTSAVTLHCQSINFQGHTELPTSPLSPSSLPTFSVYHTLTQRCWLVEKCGTVSAGRWSIRTPPTSLE